MSEDDPALCLPEYAQIAEQAIGDQPNVVLAAQSLTVFIALMIRTSVSVIVLLNAVSGENRSRTG